MNPKIDNIMVKDIDESKIDFFSLAKAHRKKIKHLNVKLKHLRNTKKKHIFL